MSKDTPAISEAESLLMQELWQRGEATSEQLYQAVAGPTGWQEGTVKALLNRLLRKQAVEGIREGRRFRYRPLLTKEAYLAEQSNDLLDRLFGGRVAPLVACFSGQGRLSSSDIADLKRLVERLDNEQ